MSFWSAASGPLIGGALSFLGQREANRTNREIATQATETNVSSARERMAFEKEEAQTLREWQEEMSNTAMQRAVSDMEQAGLNPLLALPGGASTPGGAMGSGASAQAATTTVGNELQAGVSSALQAKTVALAIRKQKEEVENL